MLLLGSALGPWLKQRKGIRYRGRRGILGVCDAKGENVAAHFAKEVKSVLQHRGLDCGNIIMVGDI